MEGKTTKEPAEQTATTDANRPGRPRRRRNNNNDAPLRYFLPKPGSSEAKPELGQEMASEGEALIEAFRIGQPFYELTIWRAVPEMNGGNPVIVKQGATHKLT